ncbi:MAG: TolC family protein [Phycisphaerales bacterium]|nr:TolC family protein [Phycisphaerales bacterium]
MQPARTGAAAACVFAALSGCQSYDPRPLDPSAHHGAWLARSPEHEGVAAFARRLAMNEGHPAPYDLTDGLSLQEGETVALFFNPDLRMARLRAGVALASAEHARLWEDPVLGVDAERILGSVDHPWVLGVSLGFTLPISGRLAVEESRAHAAHRAELRRVLAAEWSARLGLRATWLEWSSQQLRAELSGDLLGRLESILAVVSRLEQAGELSRIEARLFRIEQMTRSTEWRAIEARTSELELTLRALMGLAPAAPLGLVPTSLGAPDQLRTSSDLDTRNPTLAALRADYEVSEEALRLEIREQYPDITIGPGFGTDEGDSRVLLGLSLPIPLWNQNRRGIAEAVAQRDLARGAFETAIERTGASLAMAHGRHAAARAHRAALEGEMVPMVEEQDTETRRVADLGQVDTLLLLETLARLHDAKNALIDARLAEAIAALRVEELTGPPFAPVADSSEGTKR